MGTSGAAQAARSWRGAGALLAVVVLLLAMVPQAQAGPPDHAQRGGSARANDGSPPAPPEFAPDRIGLERAERSSERSGRSSGASGRDRERTEPAAYVPEEMLVRFEPDTSERERARVRHRRRLEKLEDLPIDGLELVRIADGAEPPARAEQTRRERSVRYAEPNALLATAEHDGDPDDPAFHEQWALHNFGQFAWFNGAWGLGTPGADIDWLPAREVMGAAHDVVVAVIDTGTQVTHEDFAGQVEVEIDGDVETRTVTSAVWLNPCELPEPTTPTGNEVLTPLDYADTPDHNENGIIDPEDLIIEYGNEEDGYDETSCETGYVDDIVGWDFHDPEGDNIVYDDPDEDSHGTHVSGTIGAVTDNGTGVAGVTSARIMPLKFLGGDDGSGSTDDAVKAVDYAVANGAQVINASWGGKGTNEALRDAIEHAHDAGVLFVAAAGNAGEDMEHPSGTRRFYPAAYDVPNIIAVAATNAQDELSGFSNYGDATVHLGAPGEGVYSTIPESDYWYKNGTSMAAPHVAGVAAQLIADNPGIGHLDIKDRIVYGGDPVDDLDDTTISGRRLNLGNLVTTPLDETFGDAGTVRSQLSALADGDDYAHDVAVDSQGRIVAVGQRGAEVGGDELLVARYLADGTLDDSFGSDGVVADRLGTDRVVATAVEIDGADRILVGGYATTGSRVDAVVLRLTASGDLDDGFGTDGVVVTDTGPADYMYGLAIDSQDRVIQVGSAMEGSTYRIAAFRYGDDGHPDTAFGDQGMATISVGSGHDFGYQVAVTADDHLLVSGATRTSTGHDAVLLRYDAAGSLDPSFGDDGVTVTSVGEEAAGIALAFDGSTIAVVGVTHDGGPFDGLILRFDADGTLAAGGERTVRLGSESDYLVDVELVDGEVVASGSTLTANGARAALVRHGADGLLRTSTASLGDDFSTSRGLSVDADGRAVSVGGVTGGGGPFDTGLARFGPG